MTDRAPVGLMPVSATEIAAAAKKVPRSTRRWTHRVAAEARRSRIAQLAAALSYRTIFALIPIIAVAMIVIRSFVTEGDIRGVLADALKYAGLTDIVVDKEKLADPAATAVAGTPALTGSIRLDEWVAQLVDRTHDVPFTAVGIIAVLTLIYAAISMLVEVEKAFNEVYKAPTGRPWPRRVTLYWSLLTLGAIGLFGSFYLGEQFRIWAVRATEASWHSIGVGTPARAIGFSVTVAISTLLLLLAYTAVPTARVKFLPALGGAILGAVLWEASKWGFTLYLHYSAGYARLYGALALVPLFLLWVYLTWAVVLIGLQVSYVLQFGLAKEEPPSAARVIDPIAGVDVIAGIARGFVDGKTVPAPLAAKWAGITLDATQAILDKLAARGLIHSVRREEGGPEGYTLARPPEKIALADVLAASYEATDHPAGSPETAGGARLAQQLRDAQMVQVGSTTVAKLLEGRGLGTYEPRSGAWSSGPPGATVPPLGPGAANHEPRRAGEGGDGGAAADGDSLRGVLPEGGGGQGPRG